MEDIKPNDVKNHGNILLIYQGNDIDTWNLILGPDDVLDTFHGYFIQMIENRTKLH